MTHAPAMMMPAAPATTAAAAPAAAIITAIRIIARAIPVRNAMPAGVHISQRVVQRVRVAVEGLGAARARNQRIGLGEATDERVIPAGAVEVKPQRLLVILAGETFGCQGAEGAAGVAVRMVILPALDDARLVDHGRGRAQVILQHIEYTVIATMSSAAQGQRAGRASASDSATHPPPHTSAFTYDGKESCTSHSFPSNIFYISRVMVTCVSMPNCLSSAKKASGFRASSGGCTPGSIRPSASQMATMAGDAPVGSAPFTVSVPRR